MNDLAKMSRDSQVVLGGAVLYAVLSFLDWHQISILGFTFGKSEWEGIGIVAGLLGLALLAWELGRALGAQFALRKRQAAVSVVLALLLALSTLVTFLAYGGARLWPAWLGLAVAFGIAGVAWRRGKSEGVRFLASRA